MHLTREADYALRIMYTLALRGTMTDAATIAEEIAVTRRFTLKILAKLAEHGLVRSRIGAGGGYYLAKPPEEIPVSEILAGIDGSLEINACLADGYVCERVGNCSTCIFHCLFEAVNDTVRNQLSGVTLYDAVHTPPSGIRSFISQKIHKNTEEINMKKFVCKVCGFIYEGEAAPEKCPQCKAPASKFEEMKGDMVWAAEHVVGVAQGVSQDIIDDLRANFNGECSEVGMYLAMARVAAREGYPEIALYWEKAAYEEAEHAAKFAELLGEVVTDSTEKNLSMRVEAENGATAGKTDLAKRAKEAGLDAIHDTVHEMAKDEARHGKAFAGLLKRYFGK